MRTLTKIALTGAAVGAIAVTTAGCQPAGSSSVGVRAMNNAMTRVGAPYVWGGQGPWGFDCSGLVAWAYRQAGYNMPGGSYNQWHQGRFVSYPSPGDVVLYGPGGSQHAAIYIGNGRVVQASNPSTGVHTASMYYVGSPTGYKRIG